MTPTKDPTEEPVRFCDCAKMQKACRAFLVVIFLVLVGWLGYEHIQRSNAELAQVRIETKQNDMKDTLSDIKDTMSRIEGKIDQHLRGEKTSIAKADGATK